MILIPSSEMQSRLTKLEIACKYWKERQAIKFNQYLRKCRSIWAKRECNIGHLEKRGEHIAQNADGHNTRNNTKIDSRRHRPNQFWNLNYHHHEIILLKKIATPMLEPKTTFCDSSIPPYPIIPNSFNHSQFHFLHHKFKQYMILNSINTLFILPKTNGATIYEQQRPKLNKWQPKNTITFH